MRIVAVKGYWTKAELLNAVGERVEVYLQLADSNRDGMYLAKPLSDQWTVIVIVRDGRIVSAK